MMSGRVWTVVYKNAAPTVRDTLFKAKLHHDCLVLCGGAGQVWRAAIDAEGPDGMLVQLYPVNSHQVNPMWRLLELPIPDDIR